ncbi:MAG: 4'-phosphopantetheinyl transferase superfamily protein [Nitrospira sp.]|nr:4'-phosphopantetheinyl transferase superfamily protein [Nitrospira sp.]
MSENVLQWEGPDELSGSLKQGRGLQFHTVRFSWANQPRPVISIDDALVHVWGVNLDLQEGDLPYAWSLLSEEEQRRADRLLSSLHRRRYIAAHAALRTLLSSYCGNGPSLVINKTVEGKPYLPDFPSLCFSLTHSHEKAVVAVAKGRNVGVDLEKVRFERDVLGLTRRFFSIQDRCFIENDRIEGQGPSSIHERFLMTWVAREAVAKADGAGIRFPLYQEWFEPNEHATAGWLIRGVGAGHEQVGFVRFLDLEPGWIGAVSAPGSNWNVVYCTAPVFSISPGS